MKHKMNFKASRTLTQIRMDSLSKFASHVSVEASCSTFAIVATWRPGGHNEVEMVHVVHNSNWDDDKQIHDKARQINANHIIMTY